jgi:hypothetical protein
MQVNNAICQHILRHNLINNLFTPVKIISVNMSNHVGNTDTRSNLLIWDYQRRSTPGLTYGRHTGPVTSSLTINLVRKIARAKDLSPCPQLKCSYSCP